MTNDYAIEHHDISKIEKLNKLTNPDTFWQDVGKLISKKSSDHNISRWQCLAETRFHEISDHVK